MKITGRHILFGCLWLLAALYIGWSSYLAREHRHACRISKIVIEIGDSTAHGQLVTSAAVEGWIRQSGIPLLGVVVDSLRLNDLEEAIARNGFVRHVAAWPTADGVLHIAIAQREPLLRLRLDDRDNYVTASGYLFEAPRASSLYLPVLTGSYRPPCPASYRGDLGQYVDERIAYHRSVIDSLERSKLDIYRRERDNDRWYKEIRPAPISRRWLRLERATAYDKRRQAWVEEREALRRTYRYRNREIERALDRIVAQQKAEERKQKKLEKNYEDFVKLLTFVEQVERNNFWRAEIVQIIAREARSGALELEFVPRSGRHRIIFGRIEEVEEKLKRLEEFYQHGLSRVGWDTYRTIDVRYSEQVVCRK